MGYGALVEEGGTRFRVWAPLPKLLEVEVEGRRWPLEPCGEGMREVFVAGVRAGMRYFYVVDGKQQIPDPASRFQPEGVHGPSQVVDPRAFRFTDGNWRTPPWGDALLYEIHVGTFSREGTFDGVVARLDDLAELGVTALELMPVADFPGARGWGYDGVHWLAPHASYGGPEKLRALVDQCHRRGIAVILDVVFNHFGPEGNYTAPLAPFLLPRGSTPWGDALDLGSRGVRQFILGCARALVREFHLDGLRLDAVHAFTDRTPLHLVAELTAALHADGADRGQPVWVVAESDLGRACVVEDPAVGGWGCDAMWADDFHHALHAAATGERHHYYADFGPPSLLARVLERGVAQSGRRVRYRGATFGEPAAFLDGATRVVCAQNHDQIGNRARGERLSQLAPESLFAVAAALFSSPFVPLLFQGEEWGDPAPFPYFTAFADEQLGRAVTEGRRREHGRTALDPQDPASFEMAYLDRARGSEGLRRWHRALAALRRARPSLRAFAPGRTEACVEGDALCVRRTGPLDETLACYRLGRSAQELELPAPRRGTWRPLLDAGDFGGPENATLSNGKLRLAPWGAALFGAP
jgi:maltooligosyltrehalose trehalohydrolase